MNNDQTSNRSLAADKRGLTTVEYIIVLGLIAIVGIAFVGRHLASVWPRRYRAAGRRGSGS